MSEQNLQNDDEIDLSELFASLWSHKILIVLVTVMSILFSGFYALTREKLYSATAVFDIEQGSTRGLSLGGELGALASIAGFGSSAGSNADLMLERVKSREFILNADQKLALSQDKFFNSYNPNAKDPAWKALIKKLIGWQTSHQKKQLMVQESIIRAYLGSVSASSSGAGAIEISVTHTDPEFASKYANGLMELIREMIEDQDNTSKAFRLSYLAETLADALQDMEAARSKLKEYGLQNSAAAKENFVTGSVRLDTLRVEKREAEEFMTVLQRLEELVKLGNLDREAYDALRASSPIVDDANFRRILGMSETISAWRWPSLETIQQVSDTLKDRSKRLDVEIADNEENAELYASSAEELAKLTRNVKIAEATFTVLTEQVKSQSLVAGFKPDTFKVFSYASPPLSPSSPKRNLILAIGVVFGVFFGCALSLINALRRGVYYTKRSITADAKSLMDLNSNRFKRIAKLKSSSLASALSNREINELDEAEVSLSNKHLVYFVDIEGRPTAAQAARLLATKSSKSGKNIVLCDVSNQSNEEIEGHPTIVISDITVSKADGGFDILTECSGVSFFTSKNFKSTIESLVSGYDQVYISSDSQKYMAGLIALKPFDPSLVVLSRLRKTTKDSIRKIVSMHPVSILFHE
ncbi:Wzz/FepE/Etk N-terminal domain-containing protein [Rhodobacteraceae bacterium]|nr:Wzz/FepE/Etk N-terminal domain-containing protein [Paracoccaceae bacterium]